MAQIKNFVYCMYAAASPNGVQLNDVLVAITPEFMPGTFSFGFLCSITDMEVGDHTLKIEFVGPDGNVTAAINGGIKWEIPADNILPPSENGLNITSNMGNVVLKKSGWYKSVVTFDGTVIGEAPIYVKGKQELL